MFLGQVDPKIVDRSASLIEQGGPIVVAIVTVLVVVILGALAIGVKLILPAISSNKDTTANALRAAEAARDAAAICERIAVDLRATQEGTAKIMDKIPSWVRELKDKANHG